MKMNACYKQYSNDLEREWKQLGYLNNVSFSEGTALLAVEEKGRERRVRVELYSTEEKFCCLFYTTFEELTNITERIEREFKLFLDSKEKDLTNEE